MHTIWKSEHDFKYLLDEKNVNEITDTKNWVGLLFTRLSVEQMWIVSNVMIKNVQEFLSLSATVSSQKMW